MGASSGTRYAASATTAARPPGTRPAAACAWAGVKPECSAPVTTRAAVATCGSRSVRSSRRSEIERTALLSLRRFVWRRPSRTSSTASGSLARVCSDSRGLAPARPGERADRCQGRPPAPAAGGDRVLGAAPRHHRGLPAGRNTRGNGPAPGGRDLVDRLRHLAPVRLRAAARLRPRLGRRARPRRHRPAHRRLAARGRGFMERPGSATHDRRNRRAGKCRTGVVSFVEVVSVGRPAAATEVPRGWPRNG